MPAGSALFDGMQAVSLRLPLPQERLQDKRQVAVMDMDDAQLNETYMKEIKGLRPIDDNFMTPFFKDYIEGAQLLVQTILERPDLSIKSVNTQETLINPGRSVRLDILASDSNGVLYNIEMQRDNKGAHFNRACLHASSIMTAYTKSKAKSKSKPTSKSKTKTQIKFCTKNDIYPQIYVVFITEKDYLKKRRPMSHIEWMIREDKEEIPSSCQHIIYVNGEYRHGNKPLEELIHDLFCRNPNEMKNKIFADRSRYLKEHKAGVKTMCKEFDKLMKKREEQGVAIGREQGVAIGREQGVEIGRDNLKREIIVNAIAQNLPLEHVANLLKLPIDAVKQIAAQCKAEVATGL